MQDYGPQTLASQQVFKMKRCQPGESFRDVCNRVAAGLTTTRSKYKSFRQLLLEQKFLPGGRISTSIGAAKRVASHNCFVSGKIEDSFVAGPGNIMQRATEAAATMRMGGGIGYDFSTLRPRGDMVKRLQSNATGPVSFMGIFNAVGLTVCSSGHRRGAQMGMLRVDHPDIEEFVNAKSDGTSLTGFNISVAVTDDFMRAVEHRLEFPLQFNGQDYRWIDAYSLWEKIMRNAWDWGEPGVIFIDAINRENNLYYCEHIAATNPCAEQPLPPFGACLLGSFNLVKYLDPASRTFRYDELRRDVAVAVEALDRVIDVALYPLHEQAVEARYKRRMGIGVTGLANALEYLGHPYGSESFMLATHSIMGNLANAAYSASALLAKDNGPFGLYDAEKYLASPFIQKLDAETVELIKKHGIRNSHLISIAPTGTISFCADNVSSGIEPVYSLREKRWVNTPDGLQTIEVEDYGAKFLGVTEPVVADRVTAKQHIDVLCAAQYHCDSGVSKTCNVTGMMPWEDFKNIYVRAWRLGAKGCTVFNKDGKRSGIREAEPAALDDLVNANCTTGTCDV